MVKNIINLRYFIYLLIFILYPQNLKAEEKISLVGSDWCPYICAKKDNPKILSDKPGYIIEIIQSALKDYKIIYDSPSWKRAILETRKGTYDAIVGIYTSVAPDFIYPENEVGYSKMCFYVKKDNLWEYKAVESLSKVVLGIIEGYFYDEGKVDKYIKKNLNDPKHIEYIPGTRGAVMM